MEATTHPRVKVCCISSVVEARLAVACGASALGLVSAMPSGPGVIDEDSIAAIAAATPPPVATFLLTSAQDAAQIIAQQRHCRTSTLQLVDQLTNGTYQQLRDALPGIRLVQVIHVAGPQSLDEALALAPHVDALLLDSGDPTLAVKQLGGTGRVHNWAVSRSIRESVDVPVFLAGGLHSGNVAEAVQTVGPFALDLCSSVRTAGLLDAAKLRAFFAALPQR